LGSEPKAIAHGSLMVYVERGCTLEHSKWVLAIAGMMGPIGATSERIGRALTPVQAEFDPSHRAFTELTSPD
jgi:hypothetical protein